MKERPILFSAPMVRAILSGQKTQTRRVVKGAPDDWYPMQPQTYWPTITDKHGEDAPGAQEYGAGDEDGEHWIKCPYGQPSDRLWVRETWAPLTTGYAYRADGAWNTPPGGKWKPSIHMPRSASRITLEITGVRLERLQAISEADAIAEGIEPITSGIGNGGWYRYNLPGDSPGLIECGKAGKCPTAFPKLAYEALWESINGAGSWEANPWVWVVEFKRNQPPAHAESAQCATN